MKLVTLATFVIACTKDHMQYFDSFFITFHRHNRLVKMLMEMLVKMLMEMLVKMLMEMLVKMLEEVYQGMFKCFPLGTVTVHLY